MQAAREFMNPAEFSNIARSERELWWYRGMRDIFFSLVEPCIAGRTISRALEAGCGTGYFSHLLQSERSWPMFPLDISTEGLRYARALGVAAPVQGDIRNLPFADGTFDLVVSMDVLVHITRGEEAAPVRELVRVLRRGGLLVVRAAAFDWLRSRHSQFVSERQRFTRRRLVDLFTAAGATVHRATYANSLLLPVALAKFRIWEPLLRAPVASGVEPVAPWLNRMLYRMLAIEARWLRAGRSLPVGQSVIVVAEKAGA